MQQMQSATNNEMTAEACAALLLEVTPLVMRTIRRHMRGQRAADLSVPQFRALGFIHRHPGVSLSDLAEHIGLTLPATSRLVDGLVTRQYVLRQLSSTDRRSVALTLSARGKTMLDTTRQGTLAHLTELVAGLAPEERGEIAQALEIVRGVFSSERSQASGGATETAEIATTPSAPATPAAPASATDPFPTERDEDDS